jgi:hypothetical protein
MKRTVIRLRDGKKKVFRFDGTNQNTLSAWIRIDTPEAENERIEVRDSYGNHAWHRGKSNDNVRGKVRDGKGFSFFFARYAYSDSFRYEDESYSTNSDPTYSAFLATVPFGNILGFDRIKKDKSIMKILNPSNAVLLLIDINSTDIISATYTKKKDHLDAYIQNRVEKMMEKQNDPYRPWLREKLQIEEDGRCFYQQQRVFRSHY